MSRIYCKFTWYVLGYTGKTGGVQLGECALGRAAIALGIPVTYACSTVYVQVHTVFIPECT
jgi:hypothetical protein